jgi:hypothetical protein
VVAVRGVWIHDELEAAIFARDRHFGCRREEVDVLERVAERAAACRMRDDDDGRACAQWEERGGEKRY